MFYRGKELYSSIPEAQPPSAPEAQPPSYFAPVYKSTLDRMAAYCEVRKISQEDQRELIDRWVYMGLVFLNAENTSDSYYLVTNGISESLPVNRGLDATTPRWGNEITLDEREFYVSKETFILLIKFFGDRKYNGPEYYLNEFIIQGMEIDDLLKSGSQMFPNVPVPHEKVNF